MPGPGGGSFSTWCDQKDDDISEKDGDISKKDGDQLHPWMVENKVKKDDDMAKKEYANSESNLELPGPGEDPLKTGGSGLNIKQVLQHPHARVTNVAT